VENRFPEEYRQTLERLVRRQLDEARTLGLSTVAHFEAILTRIKDPEFGLCRSCGAVLALSRLVQDASVSLCTACVKSVS
jgi:RNA polymerase-binding transcription factor DksA